MSLDKKIKDTFNPIPSLEDENWLDPSKSVFDGIEATIYEQPKKKNRSFLIWILLGLGFISFISILLAVGPFFEKNESPTSEKRQFLLPEQDLSEVTLPEVGNQNMESNNAKVIEVTTQNEVSIISAQVEPSAIVHNPKPVVPFSNPNRLIEPVDHEPINKNEVDSRQDAQLDVNQPQYDYVDVRPDITAIPNSSSLSIEMIPGLPFNTLIANQTKLVHDVHMVTVSERSSEVHRPWAIQVGSGWSYWAYGLNENYKTALQPADFHSGNGQGFYIQLGISKQLSDIFDIGLNVSYDQNTFESGHNSSITYDSSNEMANQINGFELTMASPVGFVGSSVSIQRTSMQPATTDLVLDLNNTHKISSFDIDVLGSVQLWNHNRIGMRAAFGIGINYLQQINNELTHFGISKDGFLAHGSNITFEQADIRRLRMNLCLGSSLLYELSEQHIIALDFLFKQDFSPLHQAGDFNTLASRLRTGISFRQKF